MNIEELKNLETYTRAETVEKILLDSDEDLKHRVLDFMMKEEKECQLIENIIFKIYEDKTVKYNLIKYIFDYCKFNEKRINYILSQNIDTFHENKKEIFELIISYYEKAPNDIFVWNIVDHKQFFDLIIDKWYPDEKPFFDFILNINYIELYNMTDYTGLSERIDKLSKNTRKLFFIKLLGNDVTGLLSSNIMNHFMNIYMDEILELLTL